MLLPPHLKKAARGFTLIELLTVISIIAVLVGLLFPVAGAVMNNSRKTQASADESRIINACMAYQTDYGKLPLNSANSGTVTVYGDPGQAKYPSYMLFDILRAIPEPKGGYNLLNQLNPRQVVYFQGTNCKNPNDPRSGFLLKDYNDGHYTIKTGSFVDPWGDEYLVWLDGNGAGPLYPVMTPPFYIYPNADQGPQGPVQVSSMGADFDFGTKGNKLVKGSDDVVSW